MHIISKARSTLTPKNLHQISNHRESLQGGNIYLKKTIYVCEKCSQIVFTKFSLLK